MPRPQNRLGRWIAAAAVLAAAALLALAFRPKPLEVETARVTRASLRATVDEDGRTRVRDRYDVTAPVTGLVERVLLREGALVRRGDVVARMLPAPLGAQDRERIEARLAAAEAQRREAESNVERARALLDDARRAAVRQTTLAAAGAIAPADSEQAQLAVALRARDLAAAEARARAALAQVTDVRSQLRAPGGDPGSAPVLVRAPASGHVLRVPERSERVVAAGAPLLELGGDGEIEIVTDVLSADAVKIAPGMDVLVTEWGGEGALRGRVREVEPAAVTRVSALGVDEQRVNVLIDVLDCPPSLGDGFRVETSIVVWEGAKRLFVPASALVRDGERWSVFVVDRGTARRRTVTVGHRGSAGMEVASGLAEGAEVILFPSDRVADGVRVRPRG